MGKSYFQFPLSALSIQASDFDRLNSIISYCCVEVGKQQWGKLTDFQKQNWRRAPPVSNWQKTKVDLSNDRHLEALIGAERLKVRVGHVPNIIATHARLAQHVRAFEQQYGPDVRVRLVTDYVFEARDKKGLSFPELAVLAAIYSKIGANKGPVRITRNEIFYRAHGFKSERVFMVNIGLCPPPIKERTVRSLIESLHERRFFARVTFARRETYYSHRMTATQLTEAVINRKTRRAQSRQARIRANEELTQKIQARRRKLAGFGPDGRHSDAT